MRVKKALWPSHTMSKPSYWKYVIGAITIVKSSSFRWFSPFSVSLDHDLIQDLNKRLDALWRYDQYIANADGHPELQKMWRDFKQQEQENVKRLKQCVAKEIEQDCF